MWSMWEDEARMRMRMRMRMRRDEEMVNIESTMLNEFHSREISISAPFKLGSSCIAIGLVILVKGED